jgi:translation initiation factor 2B subunit (eIF-2B alpha/beta/delta family)
LKRRSKLPGSKSNFEGRLGQQKPNLRIQAQKLQFSKVLRKEGLESNSQITASKPTSFIFQSAVRIARRRARRRPKEETQRGEEGEEQGRGKEKSKKDCKDASEEAIQKWKSIFESTIPMVKK